VPAERLRNTPTGDYSVKIRECDRKSDLDGLRRCAIELQNFERGLDPRMPEGSSIADPYIEQMFRDSRRFAGKIFVADDDGAVVGYACVWARARAEDISDGPKEFGLVPELVVLASHRNRGIGRMLLFESEAYARSHGCQCLRISVLAANDAARALYTSHGFKEHEIVLEMSLTSE
jgi:ribosomal protein S18 acetylase RimI-like enzyme